jgi:hypothetical protein
MNLKLSHLDFRGNFLKGLFILMKFCVFAFIQLSISDIFSAFLEFTCDRNGHVIVYIDGACPGNGTHGARGGIGVWFGDHHPL